MIIFKLCSPKSAFLTSVQSSFSTYTNQDNLKKLLERYKYLRSEDQLKLLGEQKSEKRYEKVFLPNEKIKPQKPKQSRSVFRVPQAQYKTKLMIGKLFKLGKQSDIETFAQTSKYQKDSLSDHHFRQQHFASLIEDLFKSNFYERVFQRLENQWPSQQTIPVQFFDIMANAIRDDLLDQSRPVLVNELSDFQNPFMMKKSALKNLLEERCVQNRLDESLLDYYLDRRLDLVHLKMQGKLPPEVVEPLMSFRGDTRYSFDSRKHFDMKLDSIGNTLQNIKKNSIEDLSSTIRELPENKASDSISPNHPFCNHFGFETSIPDEELGGIKMGKPGKYHSKYLKRARYPTLQSVAHSLPSDPTYRANVVHAIRILERSKGWDFASKIQAINSLIEVWKNLDKSSKYRRLLDQALPIFRKRGMVRKTSSPRTKYSSGLNYIRSLTVSKPLAARKKK